MAENPLVEQERNRARNLINQARLDAARADREKNGPYQVVAVGMDDWIEILEEVVKSGQNLEEAKQVIAGLLLFSPARYSTVVPFHHAFDWGIELMTKLKYFPTPNEIREELEKKAPEIKKPGAPWLR